MNGDTEDSDTLEEYHKEEGITNETVIEAPPIQVDTLIGPALEKRAPQWLRTLRAQQELLISTYKDLSWHLLTD